MENVTKINAHTEWGDLKEVILGIADNARVPKVKEHDIHCVDYANYDSVKDLPGGYYSQLILEQTNEDLEEFANQLKKLGITVLRPEVRETDKHHGTADWRSDSYYSYCPRDSAIVIGDTLIETPMPLRARYFETFALRKIFKKYLENGSKWISAPKPELIDSLYDRTDLSKPTLTEFEPAFDAANIMKCGQDLIYLKSNSGNYAGAKWLQAVLGEKYRVHVVDNIYAYVHLDTSIVPLKPGVVLLNPDRVNESNCPGYFKNWKKIYSPKPIPTPYEEHWAPASIWLGMNVLSINERLVAVESTQEPLMRELNRQGFDCLPVKLRHCRTLSGGPHCVTLDTVRVDKLEDFT